MIIKNRDRFNDLPREITVDILSRLPARSIMKSKCVCKAWRYLVQSPEFGPLHASRAALSSGHLPAIEDLTFSNITYSLLGYIEDNEVIQNPPNGLVLSHKWPNPNSFIHSSVNGLLFMINLISASELFICNPITREYVTFILECDLWEYAFGFGVSKSGQHKLVMISQSQNTCQVYTLGTGQWKSIAIGSQFEYDVEYKVVFANGNLHWLVLDSSEARISCLDLETELFTSFSCPEQKGDFEFYSISDLEGLLCFSDDTSMYEIEIWCMKEYGDDKSWTLDYVMKRPMFTVEIGHTLHYIFRYDDNMPREKIYYILDEIEAYQKRLRGDEFLHTYHILRHILENNMSEHVNEDEIDGIIDQFKLLEFEHDKLYPIKAFQDGRILLALEKSARLFYYPSGKTKFIRLITERGSIARSNLVIYSPSFVSLKSLVMDNMNVHSF